MTAAAIGRITEAGSADYIAAATTLAFLSGVLLLGLGLNAAAMLVPSLMMPGFAVLLACIFVLGIGTTLLQVAGNPIMRDVSPEGAYSRNLSFAQGIKGLGSAISAYLVTAIATFALFHRAQPRVPQDRG